MEQEQILSTIKEKLGQTSLSDRTITNYISRHLPTAGVEPDDAYFATHVNELKAFATDYSGQHSHEMAEGKKVWEEEWKKNHPTEKHEDEKNPELKALEEKFKAMEEKFNAEKKNSSNAELKNAVKGKADELKVLNKALWNDVISSMEIAEGDTADTLLANAKKTYEAKLKAYAGEGASPYGGVKTEAAKTAEKEAEARREAFKERMRRAGRLPKKEE